MKIAGGVPRSRKLLSPPESAETRPIPARVKESIFNILRGSVDDAVFVDIFAGTGAIGLEAISRGAREAHFVERDRKVIDVLRRNAESLGETVNTTVITGDALHPALVTRLPAAIDLAFFDPPYPLTADKATWARIIAQCARVGERITPAGFLMLRTPWPLWIDRAERETALIIPGLDGPETHDYRHTAVHIYAPQAREAETQTP